MCLSGTCGTKRGEDWTGGAVYDCDCKGSEPSFGLSITVSVPPVPFCTDHPQHQVLDSSLQWGWGVNF